MSARIIDGKAVAERIREEVAADVADFVARHGRAPGLATVLVGDDPASAIYIGHKQRDAQQAGIDARDHRLGAASAREEVVALLTGLNADPAVDGILLQLPVPGHLDGDELTELIDPSKDVDGLTAHNAGLLAQGRPGLVPATPQGVMELLDAYDVPLAGAEAVVIGRSKLVGRPSASLLLARNATVTSCHSRTRDLAAHVARADVVVAAVGVLGLVRGTWVTPGATVIDVGMNRAEEGLAGDVEFAVAAERAGHITPVPGGVGPMTRACLLRNTVQAARAHAAAVA
ncbi:MAG TPA: bifunctional 5,10-methylenetetrahydrofolate dehydrogenase/5,10-methenyltetrahydrofolate cyclohydrolase [Solirubrobacteraceae bacterium]|nr:bifunctional 5,10-methylenetetrahydrofolate dehydrogenase/5,10-methenyltetrahydrofolate cyclohydrolase [Solirubrobacteraceae bacterium]